MYLQEQGAEQIWPLGWSLPHSDVGHSMPEAINASKPSGSSQQTLFFNSLKMIQLRWLPSEAPAPTEGRWVALRGLLGPFPPALLLVPRRALLSLHCLSTVLPESLAPPLISLSLP